MVHGTSSKRLVTVDAKLKGSSAEKPELSKAPSFEPGAGQTITLKPSVSFLGLFSTVDFWVTDLSVGRWVGGVDG